MKIGFDLDGCIINFMPQIIDVLATKYGIHVDEKDNTTLTLEESYGITSDIAADTVNIALTQTGNCKPYEGAIEFVEQYHQRSKETVVFITSRGPHFQTYTFDWLDQWLPHTPYDLHCIGNGDKGRAAKALGAHLFVEDQITNILDIAWRGIFVFVPIRPWNKELQLDNVIRFRHWNELFPILEYYGD